EEGTLEEARAKAKLEKADFFADPQEGEDLLRALWNLTREEGNFLSPEELLPLYGVPVLFGAR
ncbi:MAG: hypothetical protein QJR00_04235, partial [Bacillota bacterium]|nr:hypothetical protein [Bacillota bacterium]